MPSVEYTCDAWRVYQSLYLTSGSDDITQYFSIWTCRIRFHFQNMVEINIYITLQAQLNEIFQIKCSMYDLNRAFFIFPLVVPRYIDRKYGIIEYHSILYRLITGERIFQIVIGMQFFRWFLNSANFTENALISGNFVLYKRIESALLKDIFRKFWVLWLASLLSYM